MNLFGRSTVLTLVAIGALFAAPRELRSQKLMTSADLGSLAGPPPSHRITYGDDPLQFGNLRLPTGAGPFPVVVFIHGGCWLSMFDIAHVGSLEQAIADSGFAVWSLEYRRVGDPGGEWPNSFSDVGRGADHLRVLARDYPLDLTRVIAAGHSAGGAFALWLAMRQKIPPASPLYTSTPLRIKGVLGLAPAGDIERVEAAGTCGRVVNKLMGGSPAEHPERYAAVSPMRLLPIDVPELLALPGIPGF